MTRYVIFDLDGTLIDSCAVCVDILSDMLIERGGSHVINPADARSYMSKGGLDLVAGLLATACVDPVNDLVEFRARYSDRRTPADTIFPGVADGLERMRNAGLILSICSNKPQNLCEQVLADTGLAGYFASIVGTRQGVRPKPAPDLLDAVLHDLGAVASDCIFVGDSELDHEIAEKASIPFHFLSYGYAAVGWKPSSGATFDCFASLTELVVGRRVYA